MASELLYLVWLPYTVIAAIFFYAFVRYYKDFEIIYKQKECHSPKIIFQIMTKGGNRSLVQKNVDKIFDINKNLNYNNFEVSVVTDGSETYNRANTINVPASFTCKARYKARAMEYAIGILKDRCSTLNETWILHLDEESEVTKQCVLGSLDFIENNPDKLLAQGPINYSLNFYDTQYMIPSFIEADRASCDYFLRLQMDTYPFYLHGSNLLVRADLEYEIGWNIETLAEDSCFGQRVWLKKGSKVFGWTHAAILETPALNVVDLFKQRKRWIHGTIDNFRFMPLRRQIEQLFFLGNWQLGFFSGLIGIYSIINHMYIPYHVRLILTFNIIVWIFFYQWGTWLNTRSIKMSLGKRMLTHCYCLIFTPLWSLISTLAAVLAMKSRPKTFEIVKKC